MRADSRLEEYRAQATAGRTMGEAARALGVSRQRVHQVAVKHGLKYRRCGLDPAEKAKRRAEWAQATEARQKAAAERWAQWLASRPAPRPQRLDRKAQPCSCGAHAFIGLTKGAVALLDVADAPLVNTMKWQALRRKFTTYATGNRAGVAVRMSRLIMGEPDGVVDHINGDGCDNRRRNLRVCTQAENNLNRRQMPGSKCGLKGVTINSTGRRFRAAIRLNGECVRLGSFPTPEEAARAYDAAAIRLHGPFAKTNVMLGLLPPEPAPADARAA